MLFIGVTNAATVMMFGAPVSLFMFVCVCVQHNRLVGPATFNVKRAPFILFVIALCIRSNRKSETNSISIIIS